MGPSFSEMEIFMSTALKVILIILAVIAVLMVVMYILGKRAEKKSESQRATMEAQAQTMSFYVIDKKRMKLKEAGLPKIVLDQTPKYLRWTRLPILKVKAGPRVMSLICDEKIYGSILPKQEIKATVSGLYVTSAKRIRGPLPEQKKSFKEKRAEKKAEKLAEQKAAERKAARHAKKAEKKS